MNITTVGIDLAKDIITVHAQNAQDHCAIARNLRFHEVTEWLLQLLLGVWSAWKRAAQSLPRSVNRIRHAHRP